MQTTLLPQGTHTPDIESDLLAETYMFKPLEFLL